MGLYMNHTMKIKTGKERLKTYLESLSERQKRCILILMLLVNITAFGIAVKRSFTMDTFPPGQTVLTDTLHRVRIHPEQDVTTIQQFIKNTEQYGRHK